MSRQSYLQEFIKECSEAKPASTDEKFVGWEDIIFILAGIGLKALLPELREWVKLGAIVITTKRLELKKKLLDYAKQQELDYQAAEQAAGVIVEKIDEKNIAPLVAALEGTCHMTWQRF